MDHGRNPKCSRGFQPGSLEFSSLAVPVAHMRECLAIGEVDKLREFSDKAGRDLSELTYLSRFDGVQRSAPSPLDFCSVFHSVCEAFR